MKTKTLFLAMICSLSLVGCSAQGAPGQNDQDSAQKQDQQKQNQQKEEDKNNEVKKEQQRASENVIVNLYTVDVNDYSKVIPFEDKTFAIQTEKSIEYNLQELCNTLKKEYFKDSNARIQVVSIDKDNIATINLENEETWLTYFQGSAGGMVTQGTIVETLLQREYKGDWIKGLNIQVDGENGKEYDHVAFIDTFMRDSK